VRPRPATTHQRAVTSYRLGGYFLTPSGWRGRSPLCIWVRLPRSAAAGQRLFFALLLRHRHDRFVSRQEALWAVLTSCLIALLAISGSVSGTAQAVPADRLPAALAALAGLFTAAVCLSIARRRVPDATRAALIGGSGWCGVCRHRCPDQGYDQRLL
jgi:hypothetical protein